MGVSSSRSSILVVQCDPSAVSRRDFVKQAVLPGLAFFPLVFGFEAARASWFGYHASPAPVGMVARFELPESGPFGAWDLRVLGGEPCVIEVDGPVHGVTRVEFGSYPVPGENRPFDFDGDGVEDAVATRRWDGSSHVTVESGASGGTLFMYEESCGRWVHSRAVALPDLDGDGRSELAVIHPRVDRSVFDDHFCDSFVDVKSWVTIVSSSGR